MDKPLYAFAPMTASTFNEPRAAEAAAFLLHQAGGTLPFLKLIKLMYLAERLSFKRYGEPLTGDKLVSMDHGPVLSRTYDHIKGARPSVQGGWDDWISDKGEYKVGLSDASKIRTPEQDLMSLSESDVEVLDEIWREFGHWDRWALVRYTHVHCPEWQNPEGSSIAIDYDTLFAALGFTAEQTFALKERITEQACMTARAG